MSSIIKILLYAALILGVAYLVPGITVGAFWPTAVIVGLAFALLNAIVRAILPDNLVFGIVAFILNAVIFWYIGVFVTGFVVAGYGAAVVGSFLASIGVWLINEVL